MSKIKTDSILEIIKESLTEDQIQEYAEDYDLTIFQAKNKLAKELYQSEKGR